MSNHFLIRRVSRFLRLALVSSAFASIGVHRPSLRLPYLGVSPSTLLRLPLNFIRVSSLRPRICTHSVDPLLTHALAKFPGLGLALVPDVIIPEAEQGCAWNRNLISNVCSGRGLNLGACRLMVVNVTTRL